jgi:hypothetical protein
VVGFKPDQITSIFKILSAVLLLGQLTFAEQVPQKSGDNAGMGITSPPERTSDCDAAPPRGRAAALTRSRQCSARSPSSSGWI